MSSPFLALLAGAVSAQATPALPSSSVAAQDSEGEDIVVQATRSGRRLGEEPVRVEVIDREEIEEKILMRPGNVAMILSETGGLRVQVTAPAIGGANIRVQGLDGRFTQVLADGLPLYGGQSSSLGLLQIPPIDLGRVEVIKGAVSALYGASALGGVINLVSRRPGDAIEAETLLNATSRNGQDVTAYLAAPLTGDFSASLTGGYHRQSVQDLDDDGWIDMPGYDRWTLRPRLFWTGAEGSSVFLTGSVMVEHRRGGTLNGRTAPDGVTFVQRQRSERFDVGGIARTPLSDSVTASLRLANTVQNHRHQFGPVTERDRHDTRFAELAFSGGASGTTWVGGVAYQRDDYHARDFPAFDYSYRVPGAFGQVERDIGEMVTLAGSARIDIHSDYGTRFSPRLSALWKPGPWTLRASAGRGFYAPTPFVEEIEAAGVSRLEPLGAVKAETATTASLDIGYARGRWEANVTLFGSNLADATELVTVAPDRVRLINVAGETRIRGAETLLRYRVGEIVATGSYVFVDTSQPDPVTVIRGAKALTPRHTAGLVTMWERTGSHRVGIELYYTGRQRLDDNPYRDDSRAYVELGLLAEKTLGAFKLFVNAENILNVRQTRYDPILRRVRAPDGRWTVDAWAPTEGFVVNGGVRVQFGADK
ncbi:TonB-dependent receptor [Sphingomonas sp. 1P06PA]|uniref:TonB-dependent receptor plug domain-containing protein n=1 Tax=Sphingomonas sp. 1P06PA TaxID=554121 RepID=UPI0039A781D0